MKTTVLGGQNYAREVNQILHWRILYYTKNTTLKPFRNERGNTKSYGKMGFFSNANQ